MFQQWSLLQLIAPGVSSGKTADSHGPSTVRIMVAGRIYIDAAREPAWIRHPSFVAGARRPRVARRSRLAHLLPGLQLL